MGRKKTYDRGDLIEGSMELFRDHGFRGTSTQLLVERLGVNRNTLYSEFGSKQALFDAALERYDQTVIDRSFGALEAPGAGLDDVCELLECYATAATGSASGRGCFLCNTAIEYGPRDPSGAGFVERYFQRVSRAFLMALTNASERGEVGRSIDPESEADYLTATVLGLFVMLRAAAPPSVVQTAAHTAIKHVQSLRAP